MDLFSIAPRASSVGRCRPSCYVFSMGEHMQWPGQPAQCRDRLVPHARRRGAAAGSKPRDARRFNCVVGCLKGRSGGFKRYDSKYRCSNANCDL